jgi:hypothetical protein
MIMILTLTGLPHFAEQADAVFTNGIVWTGDPAHPRAEAVAVKGGRILALGATRDI